MTSNRAVREIYERYPYPATALNHPSTSWRLPAPLWLAALWQPGATRFRPRRILVAGCGTGREAFALARRVPDAEIVAVDFSPRSIALARDSARRLSFAKGIRFLVADLADPALAQATGGAFDFISCHGVLSYVPHPVRVLKRLAQSAVADGALYLGVNGSTHHSVRWREALPAFGLDPRTWRDSRESRDVLRVMDAIAERTPAPRLARRSSSYLAGDVFGPPFKNLPLSQWLAMAKPVGWHFRGSASCGEALRGLCEQNLTSRLLPRLRSEVHELEERLLPSAFHSLLFTREPPVSAPWANPEALLDWHAVRLPLYRVRLPARPPAVAKFASRPLNLLVESHVNEVMAALLGPHRSTASIREIANSVRARVNRRALRDSLYMLYLLGVIELLPEASSAPQ